ncbi:MAG: acetamidase/formamidase family protein [Alphaproteobacteria bacterium]
MSHRLDASPETAHWGYFDAKLAPRLTIASGETVTISTVSGGPETLPEASWGIPDSLLAIHKAFGGPKLPGHICTGPVAVAGAKAGGVLQVEIEAIDVHYPWGFTFVRPLSGALPDDIQAYRLFHSKLDAARGVWVTPWGHEVPLAPFFGVMAVAPPPAWGMVNTLPPRRNGGNLDNKELGAGSTLYLPVFVDGANFSVGDAHGAQGDGEVCITAVETGLIGRFKLTARNDMSLTWPMAETPTRIMTMAFDPDLDAAVQIALRSMIDLVTARAGIDRDQAFALLSLAADVRVTQVVNGNKGIHVMLDKRYFEKL